MGDKGVDVQKLREAIKRDLELVKEYAEKLRQYAVQCDAIAENNIARLRDGVPAGNLTSFPTTDLDAAASRLARRGDHYQALVEVAYLAEGGEL